MTKAGDEIIQGLKEALAHTKGEDVAVRVSRIIVDKIDVKAIRKKQGMTQQTFADTYALSLSTLKKWEAGTRQPESTAKAYLTVIKNNPATVRKALKQAV